MPLTLIGVLTLNLPSSPTLISDALVLLGLVIFTLSPIAIEPLPETVILAVLLLESSPLPLIAFTTTSLLLEEVSVFLIVKGLLLLPSVTVTFISSFLSNLTEPLIILLESPVTSIIKSLLLEAFSYSVSPILTFPLPGIVKVSVLLIGLLIATLISSLFEPLGLVIVLPLLPV